MKPADRILELLYDRQGGYVWTDELSASAGADRGALEAALNELAARGHRLDRGPAGVRLCRPTVLDAHLIECDLPVEQIGRHVICFGEVDSTNDVAFASAAQAAGQALVVTAEYQRAGRGRAGRKWICPPATGVLASVLLHEAAASLPKEALTIAAGVALAEGVDRATGVAAALAWPNDVLVDDAKLAGVLVEVRDGQVVIGVGINVNAAPSPEQVDRPATHLAGAVGRELERTDICREVLVSMDNWLIELSRGEFESLHRAWLGRCQMINRRLRVRGPEGIVAGRVLDVHPLEGLVLMTDDGHRVHLAAATSTVVRG